MKYIFDFDDVLFNNTKQFKKYMYTCLEKTGVSQESVGDYYKIARENQFSLKKLLTHFSLKDDLYEEIMKECSNFNNIELINVVKKLGKNNCYLVTYGDKEFNQEKINKSGIGNLFDQQNIFIVSGSKKDVIENIYLKYKDEEVVFIDDKAEHFKDLDFKKCPNLKTILYDEQGPEKLSFLAECLG